MPFTYNGVGTTYYGKSNLRTRSAECEFCHRATQISEYETRHLFVVFFVPILPLGRKQILDDCAACRRHRSIPLAKWHELKQNAISERTAALSQAEDNPQAALELLQTLSAFGNYEEADRLAQGIQEQYDDDADVQVSMGDWHDFRGRRAEAAERYRTAFALKPDHLRAKRAVAALAILEGRPDEAQSLINSAPVITPQQDADLYVLLGQGYQQQQRHADALDAFRQALDVAPALGRDKQIRKLVRTSEKSDPGGVRILPPAPVFTSKAGLAVMAALLLLAVYLGTSYWIGQRRTLHIVNGFDVPLDVILDDGPAIALAPQTWQTHVLAEGPHRAVVRAGNMPLTTDDFQISTSLWSRLWKKPVFVLNAGHGAAIVWEQTSYAEVPRDDGFSRLSIGEPFCVYDDVDYAFTDFPATVQVKRNQTITKSRVAALPLEPEQVFLVEDGVPVEGDPFTFVETHLSLDPGAKDTLQGYVQSAAVTGQIERARKFIESGLDAQPVRIEWHRMAHSLAPDAEGSQRLKQRYAEHLQRDPKNSAILYLSGRLETRNSVALDYFKRAIEADPDNPYPWYAVGFQRLAAGDFITAEKAYTKACALNSADPDFAEGLRRARLALQQYRDLEQGATLRLSSMPTDYGSYEQLMEVLAAQRHLDEAKRVCESYVEALQALPDGGVGSTATAAFAQATLAYLQGDFPGLLELVPQLDEFWQQSVQFQAHLEQGQTEQAAADLEAVGEAIGPYTELRMATAWRLAGNERQADNWEQRARARLAEGLGPAAEVAALLEKASQVTWDEVQDLGLDVSEKVTLLLVIAQHAPPDTPRLVELAEKLNFSPLFPHHFNRRVIASLRKQQQAAGSADAGIRP